MKLRLFFAIMAIVCLFAILGLAGKQDYVDHVILSMSQSEYDSIRDHLLSETGSEPSESDIAQYYIDKHQE